MPLLEIWYLVLYVDTLFAYCFVEMLVMDVPYVV
jgi:uncharacterized membrane protein